MDHFVKPGIYALALVLMALAALGTQRLVMTSPVYGAIHHAGATMGEVLPRGSNERPCLTSQKRVTLPQGPPKLFRAESYLVTDLMPKHGRARVAPLDMRVVIVIVTVYLVGLALVSLSARWREQRRALRESGTRIYAASVAMGCGVCVLCATMLTGARIFWTGADSSFYTRAMAPLPGSGAVRVNGAHLLSMGSTELVLLTVAMVLTAIPLLAFIDAMTLRYGGWVAPDAPDSPPRRILGRGGRLRLLSNRFNEPMLHRVAAVCYVMVTVILWCAPWSVTIAHSMWG